MPAKRQAAASLDDLKGTSATAGAAADTADEPNPTAADVKPAALAAGPGIASMAVEAGNCALVVGYVNLTWRTHASPTHSRTHAHARETALFVPAI